MKTLRKFLCWVFAATSVASLQVAFQFIPRTIQRPHALLHPSNWVGPALLAASAVFFGLAWWSVWRGKPSARRWGIAASLVYIVLSLWPVVLFWRSAWESFWFLWANFGLVLGIGVAGLVAFVRRYEQPSITTRTQENQPIHGDGTIGFVNKTKELLVFAVSLGVYYWWLGWLKDEDFVSHGFWHDIVLLVLVILIITTLHELGHAATGLALGMKLRAFIAGPFQWRVQDGKWEFKFTPSQILLGGGKTGVVPTRADFPRWSYLCVVAAGPLANLLVGLFALRIAFSTEGDSPVQAGGALALLGAWSLAIGGLNLLPFRFKDSYSDGAVIRQLLSKGPWRELQRIVPVVRSSLVTPLRPRNYDIQAIQRASRGITQGAQGLLLRLYAYTYFLDQGCMLEAGEALKEAESVYDQCASEITPELHTVFVFGSAYVRRDAVAAREWWTRMEAKKPTRFDVVYWSADSALCWIEGKLKEANEAWEKSNALAQQLPKAGAFEFERYCSSLLRKALDETSTAKAASV